ncbi:MAG: hypothetical protein IJ314_00805 [Bacteroidales bacterium]|nr:hypothetical protein [Bacteroidales bacterium]
MKLKGIFSICILSGFMFSACTQEQAEPVAPETEDKVEVVGLYELEASIGELTKTVLSGLEMSWEAGDVIYVYTADGFKPYTTEAGDGKFKGDFEAALMDGKYVALYPAASVSGTSATFTISAEQKFALQSANDLPMVATWQENGKIVFNPVCSILDMPLTVAQGVTLSSVEYVFNGKVGAGEYTYDWTTGAYGTESCGGKLTLTGSFNSGEVYNAVVPGDYKDGFTLTLTDTDNCAMVLTNTKGSALAAGSVQKLGAVSYEQLAPKFTISYDDWAATATLASTPGAGTRYWLSKTVNGEPLAGVDPVNMGSLAAGAIVKLYGYLCSENVAGTGVADGDKLYFVTEYVNGAKTYLRSVEYTYHPDPLEVVLYDDSFNSMCSGSATTAESISEGARAGSRCVNIKLSDGSQWRMQLWQSGDYPDFDQQEFAGYRFEFYVKPITEAFGGSTIRFNVRYVDKDFTSTAYQWQDRWWAATALQNFNEYAKGTFLAVNKWTKVSIPMNELWKNTANDPATLKGDKQYATANYYGHNDSGTANKYNINYKDTSEIDFINIAGKEISFYIDHFTIRKSTLNK